MRKIIIYMFIIMLFSCTNSVECIDEFVQIKEIKIDDVKNNLEIKVYYGFGGCDEIKIINEQQTDSTYEVKIKKCDKSRNNLDVRCPSVWKEDSLIRTIEIPNKSEFIFIINDSTIKWTNGR